MEVPTIVSWSLLQRIVEQHVEIPVFGGGGRSAGLQGFLPGQSSSASQLSQERISERNVEQIVGSRVLGGGLQDFLPGQSSSSSSHDPARGYEALDGPGEGFFALFPNQKKCGGDSALGVGTGRGLEPIHAASSWRAHGG